MNSCEHTGLDKPECHCVPCLHDQIKLYAPDYVVAQIKP